MVFLVGEHPDMVSMNRAIEEKNLKNLKTEVRFSTHASQIRTPACNQCHIDKKFKPSISLKDFICYSLILKLKIGEFPAWQNLFFSQ